jgi:L-aspartate oxidase
MLLSKSSILETNTAYAQGGVASVLGSADSTESHGADTLRVGQGLCDEGIVRFVVGRGPEAIRRLVAWGVAFDKKDSELHLSREAGHSHPRVVHALGDATGQEIQRRLEARIRGEDRIHLHESVFVRDLLVDEGRVRGALAIDAKDNRFCVWAGNTILATGGAGQIYRETTNPEVATGDGLAIGYRAGATVRDLEFVQFHPTTLYIAGASRFLISEVVRGAGAVLRDRNGHRFMPDYHPDADLAARDVVSRSILRRMVDTRDTHVYLDLSGIKGDVRTLFPGIARICAAFDIDIARDPIPVRPGAHYMIGGIKSDRHGRTDVEGLYACGEVASTGLHGANRLASNSLLEGMVLGHEAGLHASATLQESPRGMRWSYERPSKPSGTEPRIQIDDMLYSLKALMGRNVGIERSRELLDEALQRLEFWGRYLFAGKLDDPRSWELANMLLVSYLVVESASRREESRGTHFRTDFPERRDDSFKRHTEARFMPPGVDHRTEGGRNR